VLSSSLAEISDAVIFNVYGLLTAALVVAPSTKSTVTTNDCFVFAAISTLNPLKVAYPAAKFEPEISSSKLASETDPL